MLTVVADAVWTLYADGAVGVGFGAVNVKLLRALKTKLRSEIEHGLWGD